MKKILSLILALLMIVSCASFVFADDAETAAKAETDSQYYDAVQFLVNYDIMHGKGDSLGVYDNIKRYEMALFVGRILTGWVEDSQWEDGPANDSGFVDLEGTAAENYLGAISYVAQKGVILGRTATKFDPEAGVTYREALAMAVRALGYTGLDYPWGCIEKAKALGLTNGITDVAYTDTLKREVVAQIVYNALFATTSEGDTLAKRCFNLDLNYEVIMITAADGGHYIPGEENAPEGYVVYHRVLADGTLGEQAYYATAESFGLTGEHDDEVAIGTLYKAVFNKNAGDGLGTILSAESLEMDTVWNLGLDSKEAGKYPIQALLGTVALVSKYTAKTAFNAGVNQFILVVDDDLASVSYGNLVAVDWVTGDILVKDGNGIYRVAWYYNSLLNIYFRQKLSIQDNGEITLVGVEYLTPEEARELYNLTNGVVVAAEYYAYSKITKKDDIKTTAYASLRVFDSNADGVADYGIYDAFRFGYYQISDIAAIIPADSEFLEYKKPSDIANQSETLKDGEVVTYSGVGGDYGDHHASPVTGPQNDGADAQAFADVDGKGRLSLYHQGKLAFGTAESLSILCLDNALNGSIVNDPRLVPNFGEYIYTGNGYGGAYRQKTNVVPTDCMWSQEQYAPAVDADGNVENNYVIYSIDLSTAQLKILKTIGAYEEGSETYVATGVLRAFDMAKKTVTIGDQVFSTEYDELDGTAFSTSNYVDGYWFNGASYVSALSQQFVEYVVVDGKVVYMKASGREDYRFLVVDSYAGISRDGYIVINAWDTADTKNKQIRIANCDGWKFGDFFYNANLYTTELTDLFAQGTVLQILSYNSETDAYGVTAIKGELRDKDGKPIRKDGKIVTSGPRSDANGLGDQKYSIINVYGNNSYKFTWMEFDYRFAPVGIRFQKYLGAYRDEPKEWTKINDGGHADKINNGNAPESTAIDYRELKNYKKNLTEDDLYILIFADGQVAGSPVRIWKGAVTDPSWYIKGWRLVGPDGHTHIFMGLTKDNVNGFGIEASAVDHTAVVMIDYNGIDPSSGLAYSWRLPTLGMNMPGYQIALGSDGRYSEDENWASPWGYVISGAYDMGTLIGNTEYAVTVLDLRTLKTITVACSDRNMKYNYVYEVQDGKVVGGARPANDLYDILVGNFVHTDVDLKTDTVEGFVTETTTAAVIENQVLCSEQINRWLTSKYIGVAYADYGSYTIPRGNHFASLATVYEAEDGSIEVAIVGTESWIKENNQLVCKYYKGGNKYSGTYSASELATLVGGNNNVKAVTIVNMDRVRVGNNCNPYDGQMAVTYLFNADLVD